MVFSGMNAATCSGWVFLLNLSATIHPRTDAAHAQIFERSIFLRNWNPPTTKGPTMKLYRNSCLAGAVYLSLTTFTGLAVAQAGDPSALIDTQAASAAAKHPTMREDKDGDLQPGEYTVIDTKGGTTRAHCPYTCTDRGLPAEHCKAWQSASDKSLCYLQDTRIASAAVPLK